MISIRRIRLAPKKPKIRIGRVKLSSKVKSVSRLGKIQFRSDVAKESKGTG